MTEPHGLPRLNDAEQEVLLCANENEDLFHVVWGLRGIVSDGTDAELRPQADELIRKLIGLGWVRLERRWWDKPADGHRQSVDILGERHEADVVARHEAISAEVFDKVLSDPHSWETGGPSEIVLATTAQGDVAIAGGVLAEAYARFRRPQAGRPIEPE